MQVELSLVNLVISSHNEQEWSHWVGGLLMTSHPCFNFSSFCIALTSFKKRSIDVAWEGIKWAQFRPQVYQLITYYCHELLT